MQAPISFKQTWWNGEGVTGTGRGWQDVRPPHTRSLTSSRSKLLLPHHLLSPTVVCHQQCWPQRGIGLFSWVDPVWPPHLSPSHPLCPTPIQSQKLLPSLQIRWADKTRQGCQGETAFLGSKSRPKRTSLSLLTQASPCPPVPAAPLQPAPGTFRTLVGGCT